ncbi:MAG: helix-turn-helix transcriptional regulator [Actinomycetota bacterium]|nr:helix-turn-helix transcriptional regulator [Actinomycetota bacterium]
MTDEALVCKHFQQAAELLGKRWNTQIVRVLLGGESRFTDLGAAISPISDHLLSERLKELEGAGIVTRTVTPATPVRIAYGLTDQGRDLAGVIGELADWAERWAATTG